MTTFVRIVHYIPAASIISTMAARAPFMVMLAPACLPPAVEHAYRPKIRVEIEMPSPTGGEFLRYISAKGWAPVDVDQPFAEWRSPCGKVAIAASGQRFADCITVVAAYEGRLGADIVNDVLAPRRHSRKLPIAAGANEDGTPAIISDGVPMSEEAFNALVNDELPLAETEDHAAMLDGLDALGFRHAKSLDGVRMLAASLPLGLQVQWVASEGEGEFVALDTPGRGFMLSPRQARDLAYRLLLAAELAEATPEQKAEVASRYGLEVTP